MNSERFNLGRFEKGPEQKEENIEKIVIERLNEEIKELGMEEEMEEGAAEKRKAKISPLKKAALVISVSLAMFMATESMALAGKYSDARGRSKDMFEQLDREIVKDKERKIEQAEDFATLKRPYKMEDLMQQMEPEAKEKQTIEKKEAGKEMSKEEIEAKKQSLYDAAIESFKTVLSKERDFSRIKNKGLRKSIESHEKSFRVELQTIVGQPEKVEVSFDIEKNQVIFSGTYTHPVSGTEQPFKHIFEAK